MHSIHFGFTRLPFPHSHFPPAPSFSIYAKKMYKINIIWFKNFISAGVCQIYLYAACFDLTTVGKYGEIQQQKSGDSDITSPRACVLQTISVSFCCSDVFFLGIFFGKRKSGRCCDREKEKREIKSLKYEHTSIEWKMDRTNRISNYKEEGEREKKEKNNNNKTRNEKKQLNRIPRKKNTRTACFLVKVT